MAHFLVKRALEYKEAVKSKDLLEVHCGFRRFMQRPIYSDNTSGDKHKYERFFHAGQFVVASCYSRIMIPPAPVLMFHPESRELVATGRLLEVNTHRLQVKRVILTGYPIRVKKKHAVVRYMFFNPSDVRWFKPLHLWTKFGLAGRITEAVGEKGLLKCVFSGNVKQNDTICMSLYKRQFPKWDEKNLLES